MDGFSWREFGILKGTKAMSDNPIDVHPVCDALKGPGARPFPNTQGRRLGKCVGKISQLRLGEGWEEPLLTCTFL